MWQNSKTQIVTQLKTQWHFGIPTFRKDRSPDQETGDWSFFFRSLFKVYTNKFCPPQAVIRLQLINGSTSQIKVKIIQKYKDSQLIASSTQIVTKLKLKLWQNYQIQIVTKLKNSNHDKKLKLWPNSKTESVTESKYQIVTKLKISNFDKIKISNCNKTEIVTKLKKSNCDKTQKLTLRQNWKNLNCDKTQKLKLWQNSKNQIMPNSNT